MTLAIAQAILICGADPEQVSARAVTCMRELGRRYPYGFGGRFSEWLVSPVPRPYHSWGNGAGMRVSPCAWAGTSLENALLLADKVTEVTHDHPEGMKGARAVTAALYLARTGSDKDEIRRQIGRAHV